MSRRNKTTSKVNHEMPAMSKLEWRLKNYLNINGIYVGNNNMQTVIINSFYNQNGLSNDDTWRDKLEYTDVNFGKFAQYAQNNWREKP